MQLDIILWNKNSQFLNRIESHRKFFKLEFIFGSIFRPEIANFLMFDDSHIAGHMVLDGSPICCLHRISARQITNS